MLVCIDGTGAYTNKQYAIEQKNSFVRKIYENYKVAASQKFYQRGPWTFGMECDEYISECARWIKNCMEKHHDNELYLAGWSRGAAMCIQLAKYLNNHKHIYMLPSKEPSMASAMMDMPAYDAFQLDSRNLKIKCMVLFDAVDRSIQMSALETISGRNIEEVFHAYRNPNVHSWDVCNGFGFGNVGLEALGVRFEKRPFFATHAAMGGEPWAGPKPTKVHHAWKTYIPFKGMVTVKEFDTYDMASSYFVPPNVVDFQTKTPIITKEQDEAGARAVQEWMNGKISKHKLSI